MRFFSRFAAVFVLIALILLVMPALVQDQTERVPNENGNQQHEAMILCAENTAIAETAAAPRDKVSIRKRNAITSVRQQQPVVSVVCDRNGWPLTTRTWSREVYPACPPESEPGWLTSQYSFNHDNI